jgi:hypothetical protein
MNGATPLLPQHAFMAWTGKTLPSTDFTQSKKIQTTQNKMFDFTLLSVMDCYASIHLFIHLPVPFVCRSVCWSTWRCDKQSKWNQTLSRPLKGYKTHATLLPHHSNFTTTFAALHVESNARVEHENIKTRGFKTSNLKKKTTCPSEKFISTYQIMKQCQFPEDHDMNFNFPENLKSCKPILIICCKYY